MAHSLRSKTKLKSKKAKTSNPDSDYYKAAQERTQRLADKLKENLEKQKSKGNNEKDVDQMETDDKSSNLTIDAEDLVKVKTHGWRKSRTAIYKKKKAAKKNKTMKF
jgi:hypothetical protein